MRQYLQQIQQRKKTKIFHYKAITLSNGDSLVAKSAHNHLRGRVTLRTIYRWCKAGKAPQPYDELLVLYQTQAIMPHKWQRRGWHFDQDGDLCSTIFRITQNQAELMEWQMQQMHKLATENERLEALLNLPRQEAKAR